MMKLDELIFLVKQYLGEVDGTYHIAYSDRGYAMIIDGDTLDSFECDNAVTISDLQYWLMSHKTHNRHYEILPCVA